MTTSAVAAALPPAEGWMEVYSLVCIEGYSVPDAAAKLNLPAAKVRQVKNQVLTWLGTNKPLLAERPKEEALKLSEAMARERLEHLYAEAMEAWKNSQHQEVTTRQEGIMARTTRTIKSSHGKVCYLEIAAKISDMLLKIPVRYVPAWMTEGREADAPVRFQLDAGERFQREQARDREQLCGGANPPEEDCSAFLRASLGEPDPMEDAFDAMLNEVETNAEALARFERHKAARARLFSPVQADDSDDDPDGDGADETAFAEVAAETLTAPVQVAEPKPSLLPKHGRRPLTRKERRARQKLLQKAKKRASAG